MNALISTNDLSDAACLALLYAQVLVYGPESKYAVQWKAGQEHLDRQGVSASDRKKLVAKGLSELHDMGIVECERDGQGDFIPKTLHEERIRAADAKLVTRDLQ